MHSNTLFVLGATMLVLGVLTAPSSAQLGGIPILGGKGGGNGEQGGNTKNNSTTDSNNGGGSGKSPLSVGVGSGTSNNSSDPPTHTATGAITQTSLVIVGPTGQKNLNPDEDNSAITTASSTILPVVLSIGLSFGLLIASMAIVWA
ncbi:hypothetical protein BDF22DRAFT_466594 [Syncephalis plumigaleata]|nr:hypothetical protein BDF22DRAFT_466594 [Syncephalis plumigaleata]